MKGKEDDVVKGLLIVVLVIFVLMCAVSVALCGIQISRNEQCDFKGVEISVFLAFLALAFAISIATPYFITKNKVESTVRKFFKRDLGPDIINKSEEIADVDAHLSRMVAFSLLQNKYYYWAAGWAFRSLKRYTELNDSYSNLYEEFHRFVFERIILVALKSARADKDNDLFVAKNVGEEEEFNIKIRAVKDYVDFLYLVNKYGEEPSIRKMKLVFSHQIEEIKGEMNILMRGFYKMWFQSDGGYKGKKCVDEYVFSASRYKEDDVELRKFFYEKVWAAVEDSGFPEFEDCAEFQSYRAKINQKYKK